MTKKERPRCTGLFWYKRPRSATPVPAESACPGPGWLHNTSGGLRGCPLCRRGGRRPARAPLPSAAGGMSPSQVSQGRFRWLGDPRGDAGVASPQAAAAAGLGAAHPRVLRAVPVLQRKDRHVSCETSCSTAAPLGNGRSLALGAAAAHAKLTARRPRGGHRLGIGPRLPPPTFFFFFSFFFLFRSGSSSFFFFFFLWSESEGVSGETRAPDELGIPRGWTEEGAAAAARRSPLPGGTGSWVRLCLCLCLFFFLGGWMCISRHCSGSWGEETGLVRPGRAPPAPLPPARAAAPQLSAPGSPGQRGGGSLSAWRR